MKIITIILPALWCLAISCTTKQAPARYPVEVESRIQQVENNLSRWAQIEGSANWSLTERMAHYQLKGISVAVINDYKIEWAKGYGWADSAEQRPVTTRTLFQAASLSKSLNGMGALKLVQEKKLDLYKDINDYLTSWKFPYDSVAKGRKITMANLLSHTGGLSVDGFPGYSKGDPLPSIIQVLDGVKPSNTPPVRSMFEPDKSYSYSGGGFTISQLMMMDITHQSYDDFMWDNVLKPLGMTNSFFSQPAPGDKEKLLATGYIKDKEVQGKYHIYPEQAAAGLWTNPTDLCKFLIDIQLAYNGKSGRVLTPEMTKLMVTPYREGSPGFGVYILNKGDVKYFANDGGNEGFVCTYIGSFDGKGVVIMANSDSWDIFQEITYSVAAAYHWVNYIPVKKKVISVPENFLNRYPGKYARNGNQMTITAKDGNLYLNVSDLSCKMFFTSESDFFVFEIDMDFRFNHDAEGKVTGFSYNGKTASRLD